MARLARVVVPGIPHHITQRGNRHQKVFLRDDDSTFYLSLTADKLVLCPPINISRIEDLGGKNLVTEYTYDVLNRLIKTTVDPSGLNIVTQYEYDAEGRITKTIDPEGAWTKYDYYNNGWLKATRRQLTDSELATTNYYYDANGNQTKVTDAESHDTTYTYTILDQLKTVADPEGNTTTYHYDELGPTDWVEDPRGNKTYTYYDKLRRVKYVRTPEANITIAYKYDKAGRTTQVIGPWYDTNQNGDADDADIADISYTGYDKANRVIKTWVNLHPAANYQYDDASNQTRVIDLEGAVTESQYDNNNRLVLVKVNPAGLNEQTKYVYDSVGNQIEVTAAFGTPLTTTTYSVYDNANRLIKSYTNSELYATNYELNKRGQQTKVTDAEDNSTQYFYDKDGRLIKTQDARLNTVDYAYDKVGNRTEVIYYKNGNPVSTYYTYYKNNLLKTTNYPGYVGRNITTNSYDGNGNLIQKTDAKNQTIKYQYDKNNRLIAKTYPDSTTVSHSYDAPSNLLTLIDPHTDTENQYDDLNRLTKVIDKKYSPAKVIQYTYYEDGLRKSMLDPEGNLIEYIYDKAKRLKTIKRNDVVEATYEYNALGLRTKLTRGNDSYTDYEYNHPLRWLTALYNKKSTDEVISSFEYQHDKVGNRTRMVLADGEWLDYKYDEIYQLTRETRRKTLSSPT